MDFLTTRHFGLTHVPSLQEILSSFGKPPEPGLLDFLYLFTMSQNEEGDPVAEENHQKQITVSVWLYSIRFSHAEVITADDALESRELVLEGFVGDPDDIDNRTHVRIICKYDEDVYKGRIIFNPDDENPILKD